jgi:hypothetical protein
MTTTTDENNITLDSTLCWQARDAWWKCLDLYDNCELKCQKQIDQLHHACSAQMVHNLIGILFSRIFMFFFID